jgi:hypothetical protein
VSMVYRVPDILELKQESFTFLVNWLDCECVQKICTYMYFTILGRYDFFTFSHKMSSLTQNSTILCQVWILKETVSFSQIPENTCLQKLNNKYLTVFYETPKLIVNCT